MFCSIPRRTNLLWTTLLALCLLPFSSLTAQEKPLPADNNAKPATQLDLAGVGYHELSRMDRLSEDQPSVTLDFVDADHVLLTFNNKKLFHRQPDCPPTHEDRLMHAVILELPSGKVVREANWYLHDRRRYLWPLSPGKFLLRKLNSLYVLDSSLHESLLLKSPKDLLWVSVTPDGSQIILNTENEKKAAEPARKSSKPAPKFIVKFLDAKTLASQRTLLFNNLTHLTGTSTGYTDVIRKGDVWLVRFGPSAAQRQNLTRVRSQTVPHVLYPTDNTMLIGRCASSACDYGVLAFSLTGHRLWRQHWADLRSYPEVTRCQDGSRFGVSTLRLEHAASHPLQFDETEDDPFVQQIPDRDVFRQEIQVFDTASGNSVLSLSITPAVATGQNFSLSPDGRRLALLRGLALELFDLPQMPEEEQAKFASLKTDTPGVFALGSNEAAAPPNAPGATESDDAEVTADATAGALAQEEAAPPAPAKPEGNGQPVEAADSPNPPSGGVAAEKPVERNEPGESLPVPTFKVSSRAVVVDVVVTDSKGHPIRGLGQEDFQLAEDNQPQRVRYFREFTNIEDSPAQSTSVRAASPPASGAPTLVSTSVTPAAPATSPNLFNNHVRAGQEGAVTMVLFDLLNTPPQDQIYARQQLVKFLRSKPKVSQFALCTLAGGDFPLRLIQGFTADETLLMAAVSGKKGEPRQTRWQAAEKEATNSASFVTDLAETGGRTSGFQNLAGVLQNMQAEQYVTDTSERATRTIDGLMLLARYLSGIAGRKNIVWLSSSFPISINISPISSNPSLDNPNYTYKIKRATNLLADAQVAVYPVDVRGLQVFGFGADSLGTSAAPRSFQPPDPTSPNSSSNSNSLPPGMTDFTQLAAEQDTMNQFAVATGGKAFLNTNGISEAIATANEQGSNYYSLSYTSSNKVYDGKFRKIKVQLGEKGYKLAYRQGYFADEVNVAAKEAALARRAVATAMHFGSPPAREVEFSVRVFPTGGKRKVDGASVGWVVMATKKGAPPPPPVEVQHYVVDYAIHSSELRFLPGQNGTMRSTLALLFTAFGGEGRMLSGMTNRATSDLQPEVYKRISAGDVGFEQEIDIPVEATLMRVGIMDQLSNHLGTVDVPLPVPPDPNALRRTAKAPLPEIEPD